MKRYKVTGTGKVMVRKPGKQHINEKKRPNRLSRLGKTMQVLFMKVFLEQEFPAHLWRKRCHASHVASCAMRCRG